MTARRGALGAAAALLLLAPLGGCTHDVQREPAARTTPAAARDVPATPDELAGLLVSTVPSGLPRVPDDELQPPAGAKSVEDMAGYAEDPAREQDVLREYGYVQGWERFWGTGNPQTTVFVDQFSDPAGAAAWAADLAGNDAEFYGGALSLSPPGLPEGCRLLTVEHSGADEGLAGPAAFAWCPKGVFSVGVSAVSASASAATAEVLAVLEDQLRRLPDA